MSRASRAAGRRAREAVRASAVTAAAQDAQREAGLMAQRFIERVVPRLEQALAATSPELKAHFEGPTGLLRLTALRIQFGAAIGLTMIECVNDLAATASATGRAIMAAGATPPAADKGGCGYPPGGCMNP
jgi:hypothetical protein